MRSIWIVCSWDLIKSGSSHEVCAKHRRNSNDIPDLVAMKHLQNQVSRYLGTEKSASRRVSDVRASTVFQPSCGVGGLQNRGRDDSWPFDWGVLVIPKLRTHVTSAGVWIRLRRMIDASLAKPTERFSGWPGAQRSFDGVPPRGGS